MPRLICTLDLIQFEANGAVANICFYNTRTRELLRDNLSPHTTCVLFLFLPTLAP